MANFFTRALSRLIPSKREPSVRELQEQVNKQTLLLQKKLLETQLDSFLYQDPLDNPLWDDPDFWSPLSNGENIPPTLDKTLRGEALPVYITWYGLKLIRDRSRRLAMYNEFAINAITNRVSYISGKGFQYKLVPKNGKESPEVDYLAKLGQKWLDEFHSSQMWNEREHEVIRRCDRDGEAFLRFFHVGRGKTEVRFVEPEWVRSISETEEETYGIINSNGDVEDVLAYWVLEHPPLINPIQVPAEEMIHFKRNTDSTSKRGLPLLFPVQKNLERAEKLLRNMSTLAQIQATFALIRKHKAYSQSAVSAFQQNQADSTATDPLTGQTLYSKRFLPGTVIDVPESTSYEFPAAHVDAGSLVAILQAELRAVASALTMPEYMLSSDASNSNYSNSAVAESPSVKNFETIQAFFARRFGDGAYSHGRTCGAMWRVLVNAVEFGGLPREILQLCELQVEGPSLIARNKMQESQRADGLNQKGILSKATWSKWEAVDREQEKRLIDKETAEQLQQQMQIQQAQLQQQMQAQQMQAQQQQQQMAQAQQQQLMAMPPQGPQEAPQGLPPGLTQQDVGGPSNAFGGAAMGDEQAGVGGPGQTLMGSEALEGVHSYSSTQFDLPPAMVEKMAKFGSEIPPELLAGDGLEKIPHITIKYGLHDNDPTKLQRLLKNRGPVRVTLGATSLFTAEKPGGKPTDADVLKVDVYGSDLFSLNDFIASQLANTETWPVYKPHITVAYLQPGQGERYQGDNRFDGIQLTFDTLTFSPADGEPVKVFLGMGDLSPEKGPPVIPEPVQEAVRKKWVERDDRLRKEAVAEAISTINGQQTQRDDKVLKIVEQVMEANRPEPVQPNITIHQPGVTVAAPTITVNTPEVTVHPPDITVQAPPAPNVTVNPPDIVVNTPEVKVEASPAPNINVNVVTPKRKTTTTTKVKRDKDKLITETVKSEVEEETK